MTISNQVKKPTRRIVKTTPKAAEPATVVVETVEVYGPHKRVEPRSFVKCKRCQSAVLATFILKSGLCKPCNDKVASDATFIPTEREGLNDSRAQAFEAEARGAMGFDVEVFFDAEGSPIKSEDYQAATSFYDADGNQVEGPELGLDPAIKAKADRKKAALEAAADRYLAAAEERIAAEAAEQAAWEDLGKTDASQFMMNKARKALRLELRSTKSEHKAATAAQMRSLVKLGHVESELTGARLTIAEASRLLQRGPKWLWPV